MGMNGGVLLIEGINSLRRFSINCKANDWLIFTGVDDANLRVLKGLSGNRIQEHAQELANEIMGCERLNDAQKKVYSNLYSHYFEKVRDYIVEMSKDYIYIRVYFNEMDDYC